MKIYVVACLTLLALNSRAQIADKNDTSSYILTAKLLKEGHAPDCGIVSWAVAYKFEVIASIFDPAGKQLVLVKECPEMLGRNFFAKGNIYTVRILKTRKPIVDIVVNDFKSEKLPTFWFSEINPTRR